MVVIYDLPSTNLRRSLVTILVTAGVMIPDFFTMMSFLTLSVLVEQLVKN